MRRIDRDAIDRVLDSLPSGTEFESIEMRERLKKEITGVRHSSVSVIGKYLTTHENVRKVGKTKKGYNKWRKI